MNSQADFHRRLKYLYAGGYVLTAVVVMLMMWMMISCRPSLYTAKGEAPPNARKIYGIVTGVVFGLDSLGLLISTWQLIRTLKKDFSNTLTEESATLRRLFVIFTVSYFLRTFLLLGQGIWFTLLLRWVKNAHTAYFIVILVYFSSFYVWDIVPLVMNFHMHH